MLCFGFLPRCRFKFLDLAPAPLTQFKPSRSGPVLNPTWAGQLCHIIVQLIAAVIALEWQDAAANWQGHGQCLEITQRQRQLNQFYSKYFKPMSTERNRNVKGMGKYMDIVCASHVHLLVDLDVAVATPDWIYGRSADQLTNCKWRPSGGFGALFTQNFHKLTQPVNWKTQNLMHPKTHRLD